MNGISPLSSNLPDQTPREAAILSPSELGDSAKIGVKRPSQDEAQEAPELKKTNLDPATSVVSDRMTIDAKSEPEDAFEMSPTEVNGPTVSYYCKYPDTHTHHPLPTLLSLHCISANLVSGSIQATSEQVLVPDAMVGLIIGRGGEQISRLQGESKCKIQMDQESHDQIHR